MKRALVLLVVLSSVAVASGRGDIQGSAYSFYSECKDSISGPQMKLPCTYYAMGLLGGMGVVNDVSGEIAYNIPDDAPRGQLIMVVLKYMENHPARLNQPTPLIFFEALRDAYPPKRQK